jgi:hypothetical protein
MLLHDSLYKIKNPNTPEAMEPRKSHKRSSYIKLIPVFSKAREHLKRLFLILIILKKL